MEGRNRDGKELDELKAAEESLLETLFHLKIHPNVGLLHDL